MTFKLKDIIKTPLDISQRLDLFNEGSHCNEEDKNVIDLGWPKGWKLEDSMWNHRWHDQDPDNWKTTSHLGWVAKRVRLRKLVTSLDDRSPHGWDASTGNPIQRITNVINKEYKNCKLTWELDEQRRNGYHDSTVLNFYIHRLETAKEFKHREKGQVAYINGLIEIKEKEEKRCLAVKEKREREHLKRLKKKYD